MIKQSQFPLTIKSLFNFIFISLILISFDSASAQSTELTGKLEVIVADTVDGSKHKIDYNLVHTTKTKKSKRTNLKFITTPPEGLLSGYKVKVRGKSIGAGGRLVVGGSKESFTVLEESSAAASLGDSSVVVLRIKSSTAVTNRTHEQLAAEVVAVAQRTQEVSYGMASISNDKNSDGIADVITVELATSTAGAAESTAFSLCSSAKSKAAVSGYRHYICILPPDMNYSWYGQAYIGGSDMVINGNYASGYPNGLLHEIGHNWGSHHANSPTAEYGDSTCIMGGNAGTANRHFNAAHKINMGWLSANTVTPGTFQISAVENSTGLRVIKIRDSVANQDLFISTRAKIGNFSSGPIQPGLTHVHRWPGGASQTVLLAALANGQSYTQNGITITQVSHDGSTATVDVGANCQAISPSITISPANIYTNTLGSSNYVVNVKNNNVNCANSVSFSLASNSNSSLLSTSLSSNSLTLTSGQTANVTLSAAALSGLAQGSYDINLTVSAVNQPTASSVAKLTLDQAAPSQVLGLTATISRKKVNLQWQASSDVGGSGIQDYQIFRNGVAITTTTNLSLQDAAPIGTHTYFVIAKDRAGNNSTASSSVQITLGSGGGGGGSGGGRK